jgi:hypothetical protein
MVSAPDRAKVGVHVRATRDDAHIPEGAASARGRAGSHPLGAVRAAVGHDRPGGGRTSLTDWLARRGAGWGSRRRERAHPGCIVIAWRLPPIPTRITRQQRSRFSSTPQTASFFDRRLAPAVKRRAQPPGIFFRLHGSRRFSYSVGQYHNSQYRLCRREIVRWTG